MIAEHIEILVCSESGQPLKAVENDGCTLGLYCQESMLFYPVIEDIPILLPMYARIYDLEYPLLEKASEVFNQCPELKCSLDYTKEKISRRCGKKSWEWEDEEFWSREYRKHAAEYIEKNWNDRLWQREYLFDKLLKDSPSSYTLANKVVLSVGCGEDQNFRELLSAHCSESTLYIAGDVSIEGLRLNRLRNPHRNSLYVLCTANCLPFKKESIDLLLYFGILHHTEHKCETLASSFQFVRMGGYVMIHEALKRLTMSQMMPGLLNAGGNVSAHEECLNKDLLLNVIDKAVGFETLAHREMCSPFLSGMMRAFQSLMLGSKTFFTISSAVDRLIVTTLGRVFPLFSAGDIMLMLHKTQPDDSR